MNIDALQALSGANTIADSTSLNFSSDVRAPSGSEFLDLISTGIQTINATATQSDIAVQNYILGKDISTHDLMISLEKAKFTMQVGVEVRNRLVEAYQQVTRMQV